MRTTWALVVCRAQSTGTADNKGGPNSFHSRMPRRVPSCARRNSQHCHAHPTCRRAGENSSFPGAGQSNYVGTSQVRSTGLKRAKGTAQREAKPLLKEELLVVLGSMGERLKDLRDKALLLT